jgi:hypothetical protein
MSAKGRLVFRSKHPGLFLAKNIKRSDPSHRAWSNIFRWHYRREKKVLRRQRYQ